MQKSGNYSGLVVFARICNAAEGGWTGFYIITRRAFFQWLSATENSEGIEAEEVAAEVEASPFGQREF